MNARFRLQGQAGERWVSADEFFLGLFYTALEPEEMLVEVDLPAMPPRSGWAFREMARRPGDYALVGVTAVVTLDGNDQCQAARLVFFGVGEGPVPAHRAAEVLAGESPTPEVIRAAAETAANADIDPSSDVHASAEFRRHLAKVLARQVLEEAFGRAGGG